MQEILDDAHMHSCHVPQWSAPVKGGLYLSCASGIKDWQALLKDSRIIPFLGIHPQEIHPHWPESMKKLESLLAKHKQAGIGECGLDRRYYKKWPRKTQEEVLKTQLELAKTFKRGVVLHEVQAPGVLAELLEKYRPPVPIMLHGFNKGAQILKRFQNLNLYISFGPKAPWHDQNFCSQARQTPKDRILIESDWPTGSQIFKSHREALETAYARAASALEMSLNNLKELVRKNGTVFTH